MGAKPKKTGSAAKVPAKKKRPPARRVPARRAATQSGRTAREQTVEAYLAGMTGELGDAAAILRQLVLDAAPTASESIKWGQPVYEENGPFCYFKVNTDHITFGFWRGTELDDPDGRLLGDGDRMKHIAIRSPDDVDDDILSDWVRQAVDLNRRFGNPTRAGSRSDAPSADDDAQMRQAESEAETWRSSSDGDDGENGETAQEIEPGPSGPPQPIETADEPRPDRYRDDDSFEPTWKDGER
jgi:hypothetical protein